MSAVEKGEMQDLQPTLQVYINRGNHESALLNCKDGFEAELRRKYPGDRFLFDYFAEVFRWMPLAHVIQDRVFVCHGGLSRQKNVTLLDIKQIKWVQEIN